MFIRRNILVSLFLVSLFFLVMGNRAEALTFNSILNSDDSTGEANPAINAQKIPAEINIQDATFDKNYYKKDEMAKLSLSLSNSTDNFLDSGIKPAEVSNLFIDISIKNSDGEICSQIPSHVKSNNLEIDYELAMITECFNPQVKIIIRDNDAKGKILDSKEYNLISQIDPSQRQIQDKIAETPQAETSQLIVRMIIIIGMALVVVLAFILVKRSMKE